MPTFSPRWVLLDIEGTTSSIAFVTEVLFPYARQHLAAYLQKNATSDSLGEILEVLAHDAGAANFSAWCPHPWPSQEALGWLGEHLTRLMDADAKQTGLKQLQGRIWEAGYRDGTLRSHVYADVPPALAEWKAAGLRLAIYSSGSIAAQKLFFAHTEAGDLLPLFDGHYDTTIGAKREAASYEAIARDRGIDPGRILFLSDVPEELSAAREAGLETALVERPGNRPVPETDHQRIQSFGELRLTF